MQIEILLTSDQFLEQGWVCTECRGGPACGCDAYPKLYSDVPMSGAREQELKGLPSIFNGSAFARREYELQKSACLLPGTDAQKSLFQLYHPTRFIVLGR